MGDVSGMSAGVAVLRERVRRWLSDAVAPPAGWLGKQGVTPDQLSWLGFGLVVIAALLAGFSVFIAAGIVYLIAGVVDLMDGALARSVDRTSGGGAFLDSLLDRAGEGAIHAGAAVAFAWWGMWPAVLAVVLSLSGGYLTSYARARAEGLGITLNEVWFGRGERLILLALGLIFHFAFVAFWILAVAGWASAAHRGWLARRRLAVPRESDVGEGEVQAEPSAREAESPVREADAEAPSAFDAK